MSKKRGPGRPRGDATAHISLRVRPEQKRDLELLQLILDGKPSINGLIVTAVDRYIEQKLSEAQVKAMYDQMTAPKLRVIRTAKDANA